MSANPEPVSDEILVAYVDGELPPTERRVLDERLTADPALKVRLDRIAAGSRPFAAAFDVLLRNAPTERLETILAAAVAAKPAASVSRRSGRLAAIAAAILLFVGGAAIGIGLPHLVPQIGPAGGEEEARGWRSVVAEYISLYTPETLADIPDNPAEREQELAKAGTKLGLDLSIGKVLLPDLALKRSQVLEYDGKPLAQIAYLSPKDGPVAFCIIVNGDKDRLPAFEEREGRNIVFWSKAGRAFMLIGKVPRQELELLASTLAARIA